MYLGELSGVKVGEWKGWPGSGPINQAAVDARWREIGQTGPAPLVPAELLGLYQLATRGPRMFSKTPKGKILKLKDGQAMADFFNFWGKVAVDPYRKQSGISKVAGGILQVASVVFPVMGYAQAVASAGNAGLAYGKQGGEAKLAERVLAPAYEAQTKADDARAKAEFDAKVSALKSLAPPASPVLVPITAQPVDLKNKPVAPEREGWSNTEIATAAFIGGALLLVGVTRR
jgi:hypothetical protein